MELQGLTRNSDQGLRPGACQFAGADHASRSHDFPARDCFAGTATGIGPRQASAGCSPSPVVRSRFFGHDKRHAPVGVAFRRRRVLCRRAVFSMWLVPTYPMRATAGFEVPKLSTPSLSPWDLYVDMVLEVNVDEQGHMLDYTVVSGGAELYSDPAVRRQLEEFLDAPPFLVPSASRADTPRPARFESRCLPVPSS